MNKSEKLKQIIRSRSHTHCTDSEFFALFRNFGTIIEILKLEPQNREKKEVKQLIPFIMKIPYFFEFLAFNENDKTLEKLLIEFCWVLSYQSYEQFSIIKKTKEYSNDFILVISGKIAVLTLVITHECLTEEEYLIFLLKMFLLKESEIIRICLKYNKKILNVNNENIEKYCLSEYQFKYKELKLIALHELSKYNFHIENHHNQIPNLESYISVTKIQTENKKGEEKQFKKYFWIPHYEKIAEFKRGRNIGDLSKIINYKSIEKFTYVAMERTEVGILRKKKYDRPLLFNPILMKKETYIKNILKKFYIFQDVDLDLFSKNVSKYFIFEKHLKGEKIISQNSLYDGIYLLVTGKVKITTERTLDELNGLIISFQNSLENFNDYLSSLKINETKYEKEDVIKNPIFSTDEYITASKGIKNISLIELSSYEIFGTNEFYNYKSNFNYFNAIVTSGQAILIFIPKCIFHSIIANEIKIKNALITKVEFNVKLFSGKLQKYKKDIMLTVQNKIFQKEKNKLKILLSPKQNKKKNCKHNLFLSPLNSIIKQSVPVKTLFLRSKNNSCETSKINDITESKLNFSDNSRNMKIILSNNNSKKLIMSNRNSRNNVLNQIKVLTYQPKMKDNDKKLVSLRTHKNNINKCIISAKTFFNNFPFTVVKKEKTLFPKMILNHSRSSTKKTFSV